MTPVTEFERREVLIVSGKLQILAEDIGLKSEEVEALVGLRTGAWPLSPAMRDLWCPSRRQETRVRMLLEICVHVLNLLGSDAREWLRRRNAGIGTSPARFMLEDAGALRAMRDCLRAEAEAR